jgi:3-hydroxyisobutyrate dehydrogenase-like beta-hydroxyacid dehydrogenase
MLGGGALEHMGSGAIWVQMGTIGVSDTLQLELDAHRIHPDLSVVDAPISGSRVPAETGSCSF